MKNVIIDIDGVVNYYPQTILNFCKNEKGIDCETLLELKETVPYRKYQDFKNEYRKSDYKHNADIRKNIKVLIEYFKSQGYFIIFLTARQANESMIQNTIKWLKKNDIYFDYIYFSHKKDLQVYEKFGSTDVVIDDSVANLEKISKLKPNARYYLISNKDNQKYKKSKEIVEINDLLEIIQHEQQEGKLNEEI